MGTSYDNKHASEDEARICYSLGTAALNNCRLLNDHRSLITELKTCTGRTSESDEYWERFGHFLDACKGVSHYSYTDDYEDCVSAAWHSLGLLTCFAKKHDRPFYFDDYGTAFISLMFHEEGRDFACHVMEVAKPRGIVFNPTDMVLLYNLRDFFNCI